MVWTIGFECNTADLLDWKHLVFPSLGIWNSSHEIHRNEFSQPSIALFASSSILWGDQTNSFFSCNAPSGSVQAITPLACACLFLSSLSSRVSWPHLEISVSVMAKRGYKYTHSPKHLPHRHPSNICSLEFLLGTRAQEASAQGPPHLEMEQSLSSSEIVAFC